MLSKLKTLFLTGKPEVFYLAACLACAGIMAVMPAASGYAQAAQAAQSSAAKTDKVTTNFTTLVGFPGGGERAAAAALLVPGTAIPLDTPGQPSAAAQQTLREKSLTFAQAVDKLWSTFRLDPARRLQSSTYRAAETGRTLDLPLVEGTGLRISATLISFNASTATFRVVFRQGESILADSTVPAARGGRAVVGAVDGDNAPYVFLVIAPELPEAISKSMPEAKQLGITSPEVVQKVNPLYPEEAMKQKIAGTVILEAVIDVEGKVLDVRIVDDPHPLLSSAAAEALRQWTFTPAHREDGKPVSVRMSITFNFKLR